MSLEYLKPARIDDILEVTTSVKETSAATLILDQRISKAGQTIFEALVTVVLVSVSGKPLRIPVELRSAFGAT